MHCACVNLGFVVNVYSSLSTKTSQSLKLCNYSLPFQESLISIMRNLTYKDLQQLQVEGCMTDTCLVGASSKMFIHRAMLQPSEHVRLHPIWHRVDPEDGDGSVVVIDADASDADLEFSETL